MLHVLRESGFPVEVRSEPGVLDVELPAMLGAQARACFEERDRIGAVAAVRHVLEPSSIAVIGASRKRTSVGGSVVRNLAADGFTGPIYPINPHAKTLAGRPAYASIEDVPGSVELGVIAVGAPLVVDVARACAQGRPCARGALGWVRRGRPGGRGPSGRAAARLPRGRHAAGRTKLPRRPQHRSGGRDERDLLARPSAGGPCASGSRTRRRTQSSSTSSRSVTPSASRRSRAVLPASKPVIAVKSGRTAAGRRAASSHTGALLQASEATVDALFDHAGVIRVETLDEQLDVAELLATQPLPSGNRVAIVTNAGGPAISCADACAAAGLAVAELEEPTRRALAEQLPPAAAVANPVDMLAAASGADFRRTIELVAVDQGVDAVIAIFLQAARATCCGRLAPRRAARPCPCSPSS
jgi:acetate---CoA ligase (ADP-forming)